MKKHIVCLGDSNTHGYCADPNDCADHGNRFNENERWTCVLQKLLGEEYLVLEEGLGGRTTCFSDPLHEGMDALPYIYPCLMSHEPVDLLIIMLGTNDSKDRFHVTAQEIGIAMGRLVEKAKTVPCWGDHKPNILVVAPPPMKKEILNTDFRYTMGMKAHETSSGLAEAYKAQCALLGVHFQDAVSFGCEFNDLDCTHLTCRSHSLLAEGLAKLVPGLV